MGRFWSGAVEGDWTHGLYLREPTDANPLCLNLPTGRPERPRVPRLRSFGRVLMHGRGGCRPAEMTACSAPAALQEYEASVVDFA